ncbi:MAG: hypothetical protein HZC28_01825 [Spirochaetes bacterium]|nr:hypothetical protein [Spirochaetota bacterium]
MGPLYSHAVNAAQHLIAAAFPCHCEQCASPLAHDEPVLCGACRELLMPLSAHQRCERCENPLPDGGECSCAKLTSFGMSRSLFTFDGPVADLVHRMK